MSFGGGRAELNLPQTPPRVIYLSTWAIVCRVQVVPSCVYGTVVQSAMADGRAEEYSNDLGMSRKDILKILAGVRCHIGLKIFRSMTGRDRFMAFI